MKTLRGIIVSSKMDKTATVLVKRFSVHPSFRKKVQFKKKYHASNEMQAKEGNEVEISSSRPLSRTKKWKITAILSRRP